jgi:hypothetical protein
VKGTNSFGREGEGVGKQHISANMQTLQYIMNTTKRTQYTRENTIYNEYNEDNIINWQGGVREDE